MNSKYLTEAVWSEINASPSLADQVETEQAVLDLAKNKSISQLFLLRDEHVAYLMRRLHTLPASFSSLDASQAWLAYWSVHALYLLGVELDTHTADSLSSLLKTFQHSEGGFGGGPHQMAHLAVTYASVNCLAILRKLHIVDKDRLTSWLFRLKQQNGSFAMQVDGEVDVRGVYCAVSVAKLLKLEAFTELFSGTSEWLCQCQTYEGGFGGAPGLEAHGGYTFCAFSALSLLEKSTACSVSRLLRWAVRRQMSFEGGFQGRTNKLVDSCYSFWVGALFPLIQKSLILSGERALSPKDGWLFKQENLQFYVLAACQKSSGGLYDKPPGSSDPYHTCYSLSGLSVSQHFNLTSQIHESTYLGALQVNEICRICPLHNIGLEFVEESCGQEQEVEPVDSTIISDCDSSASGSQK